MPRNEVKIVSPTGPSHGILDIYNAADAEIAIKRINSP